ncbi:signal transduction histidine kinase [Duganella sp. SG902]|uniref:sensor histidine kinase n=1 Tax=Duganella sp. SG902 TaxID=2587016 RepID=UPI00159E7F57|nr:ATP-binding protein [Duganella sp. SG902]NVM76757.1 signal transduction histidine kinase [Duganella sp. SG902]
MASERALKWGVAAGAAGLMALAVAADALAPAPEPRRIVLCGLLALAPASLLWQCLRRLAPRAPRMEGPGASGARAHAQAIPDDGGPPAGALLALEARLEHAPIALFRIDHASGAGAVAPLNARARRLLAPGRASTPQELHQLLAAQAVGQRQLVSFDTERGVERALVAISALTVQGSAQRLAALMPVESELEAEALNAWRELVQVLTHEIMNSLTPVASLSRTACGLLDEAKDNLPNDIHTDLDTALDAIARRAASLVDFVSSYRSLSTVPQAQPQRVLLEELFERLKALLEPQWQGRLTFSVEPASLEVMIDPGQLEQALINLLKNAAEAATRAQVGARLSRGGRLRIEVSDDGPGVPEALIAHIFTPFFSTKKQGRGIGLAMVRHLVHANGGTVRYARAVGAGARFILTF